MTRSEACELFALVLAWQDGFLGHELRDAQRDVLWLDAASECIDDLIQAGAWEPEP